MAASTACSTGFICLLVSARDEFWLIDKPGEYISHRDGESYIDQYFLK